MEVALRDEFSHFKSIENAGNGRDPPVRQEELDRIAEVNWLREVLRARRRRAEYFNARLFADPAWDMLLELYRAEIAQRKMSCTSLCVASGAPATTALRWITTLHEDGLVTRSNDPLDGRRVFVTLSDDGSQAMRAYLASLPQMLHPIGSQ